MDSIDVGPMITALRATPDHFEFSGGRLHHIPSLHRFEFDRLGLISMQAECGCASLSVSKEQEMQLFQAYNEWTATYWRPLQINRQFAEHFELPLWRRVLINLTGRLHRALLAQSREEAIKASATVPAE
jgi:hypothetical protein